MSKENYTHAIAFILPLSEFVPFPPNRSFSYVNKLCPLNPPHNVIAVLDKNADKLAEGMPDGSSDFVFIKVINATQIGTSKFAQNWLMTEEVLKLIAPDIPINDSAEKDTPRKGMDRYVTSFVMQAPLIGEGEDGIRNAFNSCLNFANNVLAAASYVKRELYTPLNEVTLPGLILYVTRAASESSWTDRGIYMTPHMNDIRETTLEVFSAKELDEINRALGANVFEHPANRYNLLVCAANKLHFRTGDFRAAGMLYYAADQVALDQLLLTAWWEGGVSPQDASKRFLELQGLKGRLKKYYAPIFKGSGWTPEGDGDLAKWYKTVAYIRGRSVHSGYVPTHPELDSMLKCSENLMRFMASKLESNKADYPKTHGILLGSDANLSSDVREYKTWKDEFDALMRRG